MIFLVVYISLLLVWEICSLEGVCLPLNLSLYLYEHYYISLFYTLFVFGWL